MKALRFASIALLALLLFSCGQPYGPAMKNNRYESFKAASADLKKLKPSCEVSAFLDLSKIEAFSSGSFSYYLQGTCSHGPSHHGYPYCPNLTVYEFVGFAFSTSWAVTFEITARDSYGGPFRYENFAHNSIEFQNKAPRFTEVNLRQPECQSFGYLGLSGSKMAERFFFLCSPSDGDGLGRYTGSVVYSLQTPLTQVEKFNAALLQALNNQDAS